MSASSNAVEITKMRAGVAEALDDSVAVEEPLEIRLGYSTPDGRATRSISITMRTPGNDRELAAGFLYTEAIIKQAADVASIETCGGKLPVKKLVSMSKPRMTPGTPSRLMQSS